MKVIEVNNNQGGFPFIIAGPCSAETESQVIETAKALEKNERVKLFRAGVWKPRTRPNNFEGNGTQALQWLRKVKAETRLEPTIEVANAQHVELSLENDIKVLWIGARTTVSPFAVNEIALALEGSDAQLMIKNPVNADLALWLGAIERFEAKGVKVIAAIHRGFTAYDSEYRNAPNWEIPIKLKTELPHMPLICDPSHIGGDRLKIESISQRALDLDFEGLMIETHPNPDEAWSDAKQQITPHTLDLVLGRLKPKKRTSQTSAVTGQLEELRSKLDEIDIQIISKIAERMDLVHSMGELKSSNDLTIFHVERWIEMIEQRIPYAQRKNLDQSFAELMMQIIHHESIRIQTDIYARNKD